MKLSIRFSFFSKLALSFLPAHRASTCSFSSVFALPHQVGNESVTGLKPPGCVSPKNHAVGGTTDFGLD
jgi:hypothetical protein